MARSARRKSEFDHAEWLDLIDISGPFLSLPVLRRTWPALDALDRPTRERLRVEHAALPGRAWIRYVLTRLLGWGDLVEFEGLDDLAMEVPTYDTTVTPSFALRAPGAVGDIDAKSVRLLGLVCEGHPTQRIRGSDWPATPADRLAQLCRHHDVELGLVSDGRWWALIWAPRGSVTTTAVFDSVSWHEAAERDVVRAFISILGRNRFFSVSDGETLPALLEASKDNQEEITEALGIQVRQAVELLVSAIGRFHSADIERGGPGIGDVPAHEVYRGSVAVLMRIVFLLFAEERGFLPAGKDLYRTSYSAGLLCAELEKRARDGSEEDLEHTHTGWSRLLALFNAVYAGVDHPEMPIQGHDGSIFDGDLYEWLPRVIDDRTVLHILRSVQYVQLGSGRSRERRKLSFRTLAVEEIGYVYEGLLSHDGFYADEPYVGLIGKTGHEEEVTLRSLEETASSCPDVASLAEILADRYKRSRIGSPKALEKRLVPLSGSEAEEARRKLLAVTWGNYPLAERLLPFFRIIRRDLRGLPVVILTDALYVTESSLRKNTGAHYTPSFLAREVVEGALEPLVYSPGPLQTANRKKWKLKSSDEILSLKVADIAMGSGAFLVAACRYLANHLVSAWIVEGDERIRDHNAEPSGQTPDADVDPVVIDARRQIIERCLYGADINEMAVELAKLSLWLVSMDPQRPFTFLDDRLVVGDSLLGISSLDQLSVLHMDAKRGRELHEGEDALFDLTSGIREVAVRAARRRRELVEIESLNLERLTTKRTMLAEAESETQHAQLLADLTSGAALAYARRGKGGLDAGSYHAVPAALAAISSDGAAEVAAREQLNSWLHTDQPSGAFDREPIHWPLVFPEVFEKGGFDAIISNPPFLGGQKLTGTLGAAYREFIVEVIGRGARGSADLAAYFLLRAHALLNARGQSSLITTNTIAQGDTREVGLDQLVGSGVTIRQAIKSQPWPSKSASLEFSAIWTSMAPVASEADRIADGANVRGITAELIPASRVLGSAHRLAASRGIAFIGSYVLGAGFALPPDEAMRLIENDERNSRVLFPYLSGQDINKRSDLSAARWVINFHDWPMSEARKYRECYDRVLRMVKPEREQNNRQVYRTYWWQYAEKRPAMQKAVYGLDRILVIALVSKAVMPVMVPTGQVFAHKLGLFASDDTAMLAILSGSFHYHWTIRRSSTMKADINYSPSDVFETLPLPEMTTEMRVLGDRLDRFRRDLMLARQAGLTKTYNLVNDPNCMDVDIVELRQIHEMIDEAVCRAYGWDDLIPQLDHGHHKVGRETRYTVGAAVQRELVDRLLELNHERYAAEVAAGLHDKKTRKRGRGQDADQAGLF
ncbi:Eco57I restriction-modification methylase domain-containing protein [Actinomadura welshii]